MSEVGVVITGPGLVVNGPGYVVIGALLAAGFSVECGEWAGGEGMDQMGEAELDECVGSVASRIRVTVVVEPMPWGG